MTRNIYRHKRQQRFASEDDSEQEEDEGEWKDVKCTGYKTITFCGGINRENVVTFANLLRTMSDKLSRHVWRAGKQQSDEVITVLLTSEGGTVDSGFSAADHIMMCPVKVCVVADGEIASAATLMAMGATDKIMMMPHATMLVHQLSSGIWGKLDDMKDFSESCVKSNDMMVKLYLDRCPRLDQAKLRNLMTRELTLTAEEALAYGFIDEILESPWLAAARTSRKRKGARSQ